MKNDNLEWLDAKGFDNERIKDSLLKELRKRGMINNESTFENNAVRISLQPKKSLDQAYTNEKSLGYQPSTPSPELKQEKQKTLDQEMAENLEMSLNLAAELFSAPKPKLGSAQKLEKDIEQSKKLILTLEFRDEPQPQYRLNIKPTPKPGGVL